MTEINYTHIVLDAIYEHSKFSSNFIKRECLKAKEKHIDNEEFYYLLLASVNLLENKIKELYANQLDRYFLYQNQEDALPDSNKTFFPKPKIEDSGITLFNYSNKYLGCTLYIEQLDCIRNLINELQGNVSDNESVENGIVSILDFISKIIEPYKDELFSSKEDYNESIKSINSFFENKHKDRSKPIFVRNGNIKLFASLLGEIWRSSTNEIISYEYMNFLKKTFSIYKDQKINKKDIFSSNFYKYLLTRT